VLATADRQRSGLAAEYRITRGCVASARATFKTMRYVEKASVKAPKPSGSTLRATSTPTAKFVKLESA
jgi:hypothetical protein